MYTYWGVKKKNSTGEGTYGTLSYVQSGTEKDNDYVYMHRLGGGGSSERLKQHLLTLTASNGKFESSLNKLKKMTVRSTRGAYKKGEENGFFVLEIKKDGMHASSTYATINIGKVKVDSIKDVDATSGKAEDNYSVVVMTLKGKADSQHTNEFAKIQGES